MWTLSRAALVLLAGVTVLRGADDPPPPPLEPRAGYVEALEAVYTKEEVVNGLKVTLRAVPDALRYLVARELDALEKAGADVKTVEDKLRRLYRKERSQAGRALFLVTLERVGERSYFFLQSTDLRKHLELRTDTAKTFSVGEVKPKPKTESWQVFEYPRGQPRKVVSRSLAQFSKLELSLSSAQVKGADPKEVQLTVAGVVRGVESHKRLEDREGVNLSTRQISCFQWSDLQLAPVTFRLYPARWKLPEAPPGFDKLLERFAAEK